MINLEGKIGNCTLEFLSFGGRAGSTYFPPHNHQANELVYYLRGSGYTTVDGVKFEYFPGTYAITEPGHFHDEYHIEETYVIYIVFNCKSDIVSIVDGIYRDDAGNSIRHMLEEMKKEFCTQACYYRQKLDLLMEQLAIELARSMEKQQSPGNLSTAVKFLNENYTGKVDLPLLAEKSGYSYNHFRRLMKKHTGLSPINYIISQRLENARNLLKSTSLPISHISQECGFSSESQFCCMFRRAFGQTPLAFRKG